MSGFRTIAILFLVASITPLTLDAVESSKNTFITLLTVKYEDGRIVINFETLQNDARYRIYRSESPITKESDLVTATRVAEIGDELPFTDTPEQDGAYYYSVSVILGHTEYFSFIPYQNILLTPIDFSPVPQPVQNVTLRNEGGSVIVRYNPVRADYTYRLYVLEQKTSDLSGMSPQDEIRGDEKGFRITRTEDHTSYLYITTVNRLGVENKTVLPGKNVAVWTPAVKKAPPRPSVPSVGAVIGHNLRNNFYRGKYRVALSEFRSIEKTRRPKRREIAEIHFYSAQCLFYLSDYLAALKLFIQSKEEGADSDMCDAWIDRCLDLMD
jgi:hypothetical protein